MTLEQLMKMMADKLDNSARQLTRHAELEKTTIENVMDEASISDVDARLTKLV